MRPLITMITYLTFIPTSQHRQENQHPYECKFEKNTRIKNPIIKLVL